MPPSPHRPLERRHAVALRVHVKAPAPPLMQPFPRLRRQCLQRPQLPLRPRRVRLRRHPLRPHLLRPPLQLPLHLLRLPHPRPPLQLRLAPIRQQSPADRAPATTRSRRLRACPVPADRAPVTTRSRRLRACPVPAHRVLPRLVPELLALVLVPAALAVPADLAVPTRPSRRVPAGPALVPRVLDSSVPAVLLAEHPVRVAPAVPAVAPVVPAAVVVVTPRVHSVAAAERARLGSRSGQSAKSLKCARPRRLVA